MISTIPKISGPPHHALDVILYSIAGRNVSEMTGQSVTDISAKGCAIVDSVSSNSIECERRANVLLSVVCRMEGINYSALTRHAHQRVSWMFFGAMWPTLETPPRKGKNTTRPVTDFIFVLDGGSAVEFAPIQRIPWHEWKAFAGDCAATELEASELIKSWRARPSPTTRLLEAQFQYNKTTCISLLMEIQVPEGPVVRTIVKVG
jgi:hypothetical protein